MKHTLVVPIDDGCEHCKKALRYFTDLHKNNDKAYGGFILHPIERFIEEGRDLDDRDRIPGVIIRPDYNSAGHLVHFHIEIEKKEWVGL